MTIIKQLLMGRFAFAFILLTVGIATFAQSDWNIYSFGKICSFRVPNTMELRSPDSWSGVIIDQCINSCRIEYGESIPEVEIKFQPVGMNSDNKQDIFNATKKYARILFADIKQDYLTQQDVARLTPNDIKQIEREWKKETQEGIKSIIPNGVISFYSLSKKKISGKYALVSSYRRNSSAGTFTIVKEYKFFIKDHLLRVTISYRENERYIWENDLTKVINTLSFN